MRWRWGSLRPEDHIGEVHLELFSSEHSWREEWTHSVIKRVHKRLELTYATNESLERWM